MLEKKASGAPRIDEVATVKSGAAPGGPFGGETAQRTTTEGTLHRYSLHYLIYFITQHRPGNPPQDQP
jgi:hypothetical protein